MRNSRWPVSFHHSCFHSRSRWIVRVLRSEAQRGGWCRRRRRATWSAGGHLGVVLGLRQATVAANSARNSFWCLLPLLFGGSFTRTRAISVICHSSCAVA
jgi:hypothetical protein